jgi:CRP/FNR family cyclic AMP-dependent transcriptional regulator
MKTLSLIDKSFLLKNSPFFANLDLEILFSIASKSEIFEYEEGQSVFNIGEEGQRIYLIFKGKIRVNEFELGQGEAFGDEALFNNLPRQYQALCISQTYLLSLDKTTLITIMMECPEVALNFCQEYAASLSFRPRKKRECLKV